MDYKTDTQRMSIRAAVLCVEAEQLLEIAAADGGLRCDSPQAEAIVAREEDELDKGPLAESKGGSITHANTTFPCEPNAGEAHNRIGEELASSDLRMWPYLRSFPCLSPVSPTVFDGETHLMAKYRYQYLVRKGVGNYLGLSRPLDFFASKIDLVAGQVTVNAAYARVDGEGLGGVIHWSGGDYMSDQSALERSIVAQVESIASRPGSRRRRQRPRS